MPAEWERHAATWLAWPHNPETWPGCLPQAQAEFAALVEALAEGEAVELLVQTPARARELSGRFRGRAQPVRVRALATDDVWLRDIGPTFAWDADGALVAVDWTFNAWGGKYPPWDRDDAVAAHVAAWAGARRVRPGLVAEGGALEVDGAGTLLATRTTLLDPRRNPGVDEAELAARLRELLGVQRIVWLEGAIAGDDTDGHVDDLARFVAPGRVVCARDPDPRGRNHAALEACRAGLVAAGLDVVDLPVPPDLDADGAPLPASYANFYIANHAVLVPSFDAPSDAAARDVLAPLFPGRRVVGLPSRHLVRGFGSFHCLTQQQPAPVTAA